MPDLQTERDMTTPHDEWIEILQRISKREYCCTYRESVRMATELLECRRLKGKMTTPKKHWIEQLITRDVSVALESRQIQDLASELAAYRAGILEANCFIFRSTSISLPAFDKALELAKK